MQWVSHLRMPSAYVTLDVRAKTTASWISRGMTLGCLAVVTASASLTAFSNRAAHQYFMHAIYRRNEMTPSASQQAALERGSRSCTIQLGLQGQTCDMSSSAWSHCFSAMATCPRPPTALAFSSARDQGLRWGSTARGLLLAASAADAAR